VESTLQHFAPPPDSFTAGPRGLPDLGALVDQSPVASVYVDAELRYVRVNDEFCRFAGAPREEIVGRRIAEGPAGGLDRGMVERVLAEQVLAGAPLVQRPAEQATGDARRVYAWSAFPITDNGRVAGVVSWLFDITEREREAADLERARARLDLLDRASSQIGTSLDIRQTCAELARLAVPELADRVVVDLLDQVMRGEDPGRDHRGDAGFVRLRRVIMAGPSLGYREGDEIIAPLTHARVAALFGGAPLLAPSLAGAASQVGYTRSHAEGLLAGGVHTLMAVPLIARGTTLGVVALGRVEQPQPYSEADLQLVSDLASRAAMYIDNARLYAREHDTAVTLQRSLLPRAIPDAAGVQVAHRYQPANRSAEAGGDWFDVIPLQDGQVALVIGDVTGHNIRAAAIMGQLRTATATLARLGRPPQEIMRQLSRLIASHDPEAGATCLYALYDPRTGQGRFTSAGHPPPAVRHPDGRVEFIDVRPGTLLGVHDDCYPRRRPASPRAPCSRCTPTASWSSQARTSGPACPGSRAPWPAARHDPWTSCATRSSTAPATPPATTSPCCSPARIRRPKVPS
jgi:PAS domain S-box-containing protein